MEDFCEKGQMKLLGENSEEDKREAEKVGEVEMENIKYYDTILKKDELSLMASRG